MIHLVRVLKSIFGNEMCFLPKTKEELIGIVQEASQRYGSAVVDPSIIKMLKRLLQFSDTTAGQVMVPQSQLKVLNKTDDLEAAVSIIRESGHSRFPVVSSNPDNVVGIALAKEILAFAARPFDAQGQFNWNDFIRQAKHIPDTKPINILLEEIQQTSGHMVIVANEYGNVAGIVTLEDILEEIVGEITDESEKEIVEQIVQTDKHVYLIHPLTSLTTLEQELPISIASKSHNTIAGYLFENIGRMAKKKDVVALDNGRFEILKVSKRGIEKIRLTLYPDD